MPGVGQTIQAAARLTVLRLRRGRSVWLAVAIAGLLLLVAAVIRFTTDVEPETLWTAMIDYPFRRVLVFLAPFLFCATALSEEIEARTATYLFSRPASRSAILLGKWVAGAGLAALIVCGAVALLYVICWSSGEDAVSTTALGRALLGFAIATTCYGSMFLCFGVMLVDAPYLLCVLWVGIVEIAVSFLPGVIRLASMSTHLAKVLGHHGDEPTQIPFFAGWNPEVGGTASAVVLVAVGAIFLGAATMFASSTELRYGKA
jgi:ABC-type transport system involved in multi-copper enzyme maturation permease subunit